MKSLDRCKTDAEFARTLTQSARLDEPEIGTEERLLTALGLAGAGAIASAAIVSKTVAAAAKGATSGAGLSAGAAANASLGSATVAMAASKIAFGSMLALTVAGGTYLGVRQLWNWHSTTATPSISTSPIASIVPSIAEPRSVPDTPVIVPIVRVSDLRDVADVESKERSRSAPFAASTAVAPPEPPPRALSPLDAEISAVDAIKRALVRGEVAAALEQIDRYGAAFPEGALAPEVLALEVDAQARNGKIDRVCSLGATFMARHGLSPLATRVRRRVEAAGCVGREDGDGRTN